MDTKFFQRGFLIIAFLAVDMLCGPRFVLATWPTDPKVNVPVCIASNGQIAPYIVSDGAGGAIIGWADYRSGSLPDIYVQRVDASGNVAWMAGGVPICTALNRQEELAMMPDGFGGAIIVWRDGRDGVSQDIYAQRVDASGTAQWTTNGVLVCVEPDLTQSAADITTDGSGGAIIVWHDERNISSTGWDIYAQRIDAYGVVQWSAIGVPICTASGNQSYPVIVSDGSGGVIISWLDKRNAGISDWDIYAQRVDAYGTSLWTIDGVPICTAGADQGLPRMITSGFDGAIIAWDDWRNGNGDIYAQRVDGGGVVQWPLNGVPVCTASGIQADPYLVGDDVDGAIISWADWRNISSTEWDIYAQHVDVYGATQWLSNGFPICTTANSQLDPNMVSDGLGGAIITWVDKRNDILYTDIYAQQVNASGAIQWTVNGVPICTAANNQYLSHLENRRTIVSTGPGTAIITWYDNRNASVTGEDIYAQAIVPTWIITNFESQTIGTYGFNNAWGNALQKVQWAADPTGSSMGVMEAIYDASLDEKGAFEKQPLDVLWTETDTGATAITYDIYLPADFPPTAIIKVWARDLVNWTWNVFIYTVGDPGAMTIPLEQWTTVTFDILDRVANQPGFDPTYGLNAGIEVQFSSGTTWTGSIYIDNITLIGVQRPAGTLNSPSNVTAIPDSAIGPYGSVMYFNKITWTQLPENYMETYNLYVSEEPVTQVPAAGVIKLDSQLPRFSSGIAPSYHHVLYSSWNERKTWYYAMTTSGIEGGQLIETPVIDGISNTGPVTSSASIAATIPLVSSFDFEIDGDIREFEAFPEAIIRPAFIDGPASIIWDTNSVDLNFSMYFVMDQDYLYIGAKVIDDDPYNGTQAWEGDGLDIFAGFYDVSKEMVLHSLGTIYGDSTADYRLSFCVNAEEGNQFQKYGYLPWNLPGLAFGIDRTPPGYIVEAKFPFASLKPPDAELFVPENDIFIPLTISVNDNDGTNDPYYPPLRTLILMTGGNLLDNMNLETWKRPSTWGWAYIKSPTEGWDVAGRINYYSNDEPVDSALVKANSVYIDTTDTNGNYKLLDLPSDNYVVRPEKEFDMGNSISAFDAAWILQYGVGLRTFTPYQMIAGDVSGNGSVSAFDAAKILQYGVGLINQFPVMSDNTHFWRFVPGDFPISQSNWNTAPDSIAYTPLNRDTTDNYFGIIYGDVSGNWHPTEGSLAKYTVASGTVDIRLEDVYGKSGDRISVPVYMDNGSGIIAMSFFLAYDPQVLKAVVASLTSFAKDFQIAYNLLPGRIKVALAGSQSLIGSGAVVNLELEVVATESPDATSRLEITEMVINEGSIAANVQAAEFRMGAPVPTEYVLEQNYPNPFNPETLLKYQLPRSGKVVLKIFNTLGQEIRNLISEDKEAGYHVVCWDGKDDKGVTVASGIYVYHFRSGDFVSVRKMLFLR